ncbi:MAG: hypothetical protein ACLFUN_01310 [Desulfobacterales bacterium]
MRVSGRVEPYISVEPGRVNLRGRAGDEISETVRIFPETDETFHVLEVSAARGSDIELELDEIKESGKNGYVLHVRNTRKKPGRYYDSIRLRTDSKRMENITIAVSGIIQAQEQQTGRD